MFSMHPVCKIYPNVKPNTEKHEERKCAAPAAATIRFLKPAVRALARMNAQKTGLGAVRETPTAIGIRGLTGRSAYLE